MSIDGVKFEDIEPEKRYQVELRCADCGHLLNTSVRKSGKDLKESWTMMVMSSGFAASSCPNGCRATFSDLNINTRMRIVEVLESLKVDKTGG